ncbi:MAG: GntR family transcriptional regulator [Candidatus Leucobacter sulfamidivorax]|nr:GntR family transcriptional regulator [Candidatus Leucobacter sulfamidivorax]
MSLTEKVYEQLKMQILRVEKAPGDVIFEADLAEEFGVSRTPVREALSLLANRGWVVVLPRKGYLIRPVELRDIGEIFTVRRMLEPSLAELAARSTNPAQLERLRALIEQQESSAELADALEAARGFHLLLAELSGSERLRSMLTDLVEEVQRLHYLLPSIEHHITSADELRAHRLIIEAIASGDPERARAQMVEHLQEVAQTLVKGFSGV